MFLHILISAFCWTILAIFAIFRPDIIWWIIILSWRLIIKIIRLIIAIITFSFPIYLLIWLIIHAPIVIWIAVVSVWAVFLMDYRYDKKHNVYDWKLEWNIEEAEVIETKKHKKQKWNR